jgi:hypothetical protein
MYSHHRNLDIALATIIAILGGLAAAKHMPGQVTIPLGVGLFFAPGYLWSQAILGQRLQGIERAMTTAGMALVFPILGGFLFYALHIPLFRSDWVGMLVVLTLLGVVAVAIQRLREAPADRPQQPRRGQRPRQHGSLVLNSVIFVLAGLISVGAIGYSVKSAEAQKFSAYTSMWTSPIVNDSALRNMDALAGNSALQQTAAQAVNQNQQKATQASILVTNHQGATEQYRLNLLEKGKVTKTWNFTLNDGQSWDMVVPWTYKYSMVTALYMLPDLTKYVACDDNGPNKFCTGA